MASQKKKHLLARTPKRKAFSQREIRATVVPQTLTSQNLQGLREWQRRSDLSLEEWHYHSSK